MTNRTASINHETLSDKAHESRHFEPLPSTLTLIAKMRTDNDMIRAEETRLGRKMSNAEKREFLVEMERLEAYAAELRECREAWNMDRVSDCHYTSGWCYRMSMNDEGIDDIYEMESSAYVIAAGIFAAQVVGSL